ncbi:hypothetical protein DEU56DRAFT_755863 [Suillus clintonianus]|uniref:uncharacterized protein n=1 Tax=Suillus clintonianus TaxID=1904413 RepID=UPI001B879EAE|nr:uncharacterized protein DEU56DRAFT_755863 [Suillus clintonianus]KAG2138288.1 hypothetical protein DEU56DRAFT_755863 [Suillus clintonianus]
MAVRIGKWGTVRSESWRRNELCGFIMGLMQGSPDLGRLASDPKTRKGDGFSGCFFQRFNFQVIMNQDMKPEFLFLADLHIYILTFLPYQDILRCTSVCRDLRQTYLSSPELQYLVELGGQQLLPVDLRVDNHCTPISERLQLLRDKAHAWFKFDTRPTETVVVPDRFQFKTTSVSNQHITLVDTCEIRCHPGFAKIFPILPEPSQQAIDREWYPETLFPVPNGHQIDLLMDPMQNLVAAAYDANDGSDVCINLLPLDRDGTHPQAAGPTLFTSTALPRRLNVLWKVERWKLRGLGRHIALWHSLLLHDPDRVLWWLQIWDWQYSATSNSVLSGTEFNTKTDRLIDYCFLENDRLLMIVGVNLRVYLIEDISQAPKFLACFLLPAPVESAQFLRGSKNDVAYRSQPGMQQEMWTSDPTHQYYEEFLDATGGSRVLRAVKHRQGLGQLVREPSTIDLDGELVTTSLPYVEVLSSKKSIPNQFVRFISMRAVYAVPGFKEESDLIFNLQVKVIKIWDGV